MLGDVGGLHDGLAIIFIKLIGLFTPTFFAAKRSSQLFYYTPKNKDLNHDQSPSP